MKFKITGIFIIITIGILSLIFRAQVSSYFSGPTLPKVESGKLTKNSILKILTDRGFADYTSNPLKIEPETLEKYDIVTIHLWASWCAPCVNEVPELIEFAKRVTAKNSQNLKVLFITVTLDDAEEDINKFLKSFPEFNKEPFVRIWDKDKYLSKVLNADRLPMTVIINKNREEPRFVNGVVEWKKVEL